MLFDLSLKLLPTQELWPLFKPFSLQLVVSPFLTFGSSKKKIPICGRTLALLMMWLWKSSIVTWIICKLHWTLPILRWGKSLRLDRKGKNKNLTVHNEITVLSWAVANARIAITGFRMHHLSACNNDNWWTLILNGFEMLVFYHEKVKILNKNSFSRVLNSIRFDLVLWYSR